MRRILAVFVVLGFMAIPALADYAHPPDWDDKQYFTHQSWDFLGNSSQPTPDGEPPQVNPRTPRAFIKSGYWTQNHGSGDGGWRIDGPLAFDPSQPQIMLIIPNVSNDELRKEVWLQLSYQAGYPLNAGENLEVYALANGSQAYPTLAYEREVIDAGRGLGRVTAWIDIFPQPDCESIKIAVGIPAGQWIFFDEIDVDTRCLVPEPATPAMLLFIAMLRFVLYRRKP